MTACVTSPSAIYAAFDRLSAKLAQAPALHFEVWVPAIRHRARNPARVFWCGQDVTRDFAVASGLPLDGLSRVELSSSAPFADLYALAEAVFGHWNAIRSESRVIPD